MRENTSCRKSSQTRAEAFDREQVLGYLNEATEVFIRRMEIVFVATADVSGPCDGSIRERPPGFTHVWDSRRTLAYPEDCGHGVAASHRQPFGKRTCRLLFADVLERSGGLHMNRHVSLVSSETALSLPHLKRDLTRDVGVEGGTL